MTEPKKRAPRKKKLVGPDLTNIKVGVPGHAWDKHLKMWVPRAMGDSTSLGVNRKDLRRQRVRKVVALTKSKSPGRSRSVRGRPPLAVREERAAKAAILRAAARVALWQARHDAPAGSVALEACKAHPKGGTRTPAPRARTSWHTRAWAARRAHRG